MRNMTAREEPALEIGNSSIIYVFTICHYAQRLVVDTTPSAAMTASSSALLLVCSRPGKWKDIFLGSRGPNHTPQPAKPTPGASSENEPSIPQERFATAPPPPSSRSHAAWRSGL